MQAVTLAEQAEENFLVHTCYLLERTAGMRVFRLGLASGVQPQLIIADSRLACDSFNVIFRARLNGDATTTVTAAISEFDDRPFTWWTGASDQPDHLPDLLLRAGLKPTGDCLVMAAELETLEPPPNPERLTIERAATPEHIERFAQTIAVNHEPPEPLVPEFYRLAAPALLQPDCPIRLYVGYLDGHAVATSELTIGGGVAGIYNVATLPEYRRRGIGAAITAHAMLEGRSAGLREAALQAELNAVGLYSRLGFKELGVVTEFKLSSSRAASDVP